ncbi:MAG TPA: dihydrolipoyl dehydrogenase [Thermoanaerobaculia bacterium]|nr:dihydrolipoyl dehydrogenase [Thermoanaerobaculia bacterium]
MSRVEVKVPDIGDFDQVDVVEVIVAVGDRVAVDDPLITLESDKASMEVPATAAGVVAKIAVAVGDQVAEGDLIVVLESESEGSEEKPEEKPEGKTEGKTEKTAEEPPEEREEAAAAATRSPQPRGYDTQLVVLGSGPGGYSAAFRAADLGLRVTLVERYPTLGGVCLNVGCIPSKALLHAAKVMEEASSFAEHGIAFGEPKIDLGRLRAWKDEVVGKLTGGVTQMAKRREVEVIQGSGTFADGHVLEIEKDGERRRLTFEQAIVAVGSRPIEIPGIPWGDPRVLDSTGALELEEVPERLLVIGGGIIGLEMACVYDALGSKVSVVELLAGLMPGVDRDLVRVLQKRIAARYENIWTGTRVTGVVAAEAGLVASFEGAGAPDEATFDSVLVAVGRRPNGDRIGAEAAGLEVDERGFLRSDDQLRTNVPHIFAIGDVAGQPMLAHKATHEGKVAAEVAAGEKSGWEGRVVPSVAYTDPEVAWVGLTETEAAERGLEVGKGVFPWVANGRSLSLGRSEGSTKLLFDRETGRLVGAGIVGPNAGELIAEAGLAIEMGSDAEDLGLTVHAHPTLSETVAGAAEVFAGTVTDLYLPKRR